MQIKNLTSENVRTTTRKMKNYIVYIFIHLLIAIFRRRKIIANLSKKRPKILTLKFGSVQASLTTAYYIFKIEAAKHQ